MRYSRSPQWRGTWLYGFSIGHDVNDRIHLYAASNQFLIPPTATQIYGGSPGTMRYLANLGLKPITGTSNEVGGSIRFDNTAWMDFAFFTRRQKNTIVLGYPDPHDTTLRRYYNESYNKSVHGAEFGFFKRFAKYFTGRLGYTHLDTAHDDLIQRYPHDKFTVGLSYAREKFDINLEDLGFYDIVPVTRFVEKHKKYLPEQTYWVWNLSANYRIDRNAKIFLNVNNIFDLYYMTLVDYDSVADGMRYYSKPGRNIMLGVEYSF